MTTPLLERESPLSRAVEDRSPRVPRIDGLTGARFLFAMLVVAHHTLSWFFGTGVAPAADFGYIGVDCFFVLSGFVLSWAGPPRSVRRYFRGRFARIWPLHLSALLVALCLVGHGLPRPSGAAIAANALLVQAWSPHPGTYFSLDQVSWSLSVEVAFYLLFPVLVRPLARAGRRARRRAAVLAVAAMLCYPGVFSLTVAPHAPAAWEWSTYVLPVWRLGEFVLGMVAALEVRDGWRPAWSARTAVAAASAAAVAAVTVGTLRGGLPNRPLIEIAGAVLAAGVYAAVAADEQAGRRTVLAHPALVRLGAASFALFLCHGLLFAPLTLTAWHQPLLVSLAGWAAFVAVSVATACAAHRWLEVPTERWIRGRR